MKNCRLCRWFALAVLIVAVPMLRDGSAVPAPSPKGGVVVLDDCDPVYQDKQTYKDNLSFINTDGKLVFRVSGLNGCRAIGSNHLVATDPKRGWVWVVESVGERIHKYDRSGKELVVLKDIKASALAVDPETGDLWAVTSKGTIHGDKTVVFDANGVRRAVHDFSGWDIAYDAKTRAFWLANSNLKKVQNGKVVINKPITAWCASSLAINPATGMIWVAVRRHPQVANSKNELLGFDTDGNLQRTIPLDEKMPFHVSVDGHDGTVWLTLLRKSVRRYTAEGGQEAEHELKALAAQADDRSGGVWVVTPEETVLLSRKGEFTLRIRHAGETSQAWIAGW